MLLPVSVLIRCRQDAAASISCRILRHTSRVGRKQLLLLQGHIRLLTFSKWSKDCSSLTVPLFGEFVCVTVDVGAKFLHTSLEWSQRSRRCIWGHVDSRSEGFSILIVPPVQSSLETAWSQFRPFDWRNCVSNADLSVLYIKESNQNIVSRSAFDDSSAFKENMFRNRLVAATQKATGCYERTRSRCVLRACWENERQLSVCLPTDGASALFHLYPPQHTHRHTR